MTSMSAVSRRAADGINRILVLDYVVRENCAGYCVIESMTITGNTTHQRLIKHALTRQAAQEMAQGLQVCYNLRGIRA